MEHIPLLTQIAFSDTTLAIMSGQKWNQRADLLNQGFFFFFFNFWNSFSLKRYKHASIVTPDGKMYVFGGNNGDGFFNDLNYYDINLNKWVIVQTTNKPQARSLMSKKDFFYIIFFFFWHFFFFEKVWLILLTKREKKSCWCLVDCSSKIPFFFLDFIFLIIFFLTTVMQRGSGVKQYYIFLLPFLI